MRTFLFALSAMAVLFPSTALPRLLSYDSLATCWVEIERFREGTVESRTASGRSSCDVEYARAEIWYERYGIGNVEAGVFASGADIRTIYEHITSIADASLQLSEGYITDGPPRDGLAYIWLSGEVYGGASWFYIAVAGVELMSWDCLDGQCSNWDTSDLSARPTPIPFRLGERFDMYLDGGVISSLDPGFFRAAARIELYEADGVTPVPLADLPVPEPGTMILVGTGGVLVWLTRRR